MDMEKRIMREKIEALEFALNDVVKQCAEKDVEIHRLAAENHSLRTNLAMVMRDREFSVNPVVIN